MKKILAAGLAVTMAASMTSVAFASTVSATNIKVDDSSRLYTEKDGVLYDVTGTDLMVKPGQSIYIEILPENSGEEIPNSLPGKYKVVAEWNHGKELVESAAIETRKTTKTTFDFSGTGTAPHSLAASYSSEQAMKDAVAAVKIHDDVNFTDGTACSDPAAHAIALDKTASDAIIANYKATTANSYRSVAAIKTKTGYNVKQDDLIGSVKVIKKSSSTSTSAESMKLNAVVGYAQTDVSNVSEITNDSPVANFENVDDEVELLFSNAASFTVNGKNQSNLFLGFSLKPNNDVIDQNPTANIDFVKFTAKPSFNRIGELRLFTNEENFIYEVGSKGLKAVAATYDEAYEAYVINTRTLGEYVISDRELEYTPDAESKPETNPGGSTPGDKPENPDTGAGVMLSSVIALAGASALAMGATRKRK